MSINLSFSNQLDCSDIVCYTEDKSTQTSMDLIRNNFEFYCISVNNHLNTQANIISLKSLYFKPKMVDKFEGSVDYDGLEYFSDIRSNRNEGHLISLCGEEEITKTCNIVSVRIHVERSIQKIKMYKVLEKIPTKLLECIDDITFYVVS